MRNSEKRYKKQLTPKATNNGWPEWFKETNNPAEVELLSFILKNNTQLSEVYVTVKMMEINYLVFKSNYDEIKKLETQFDRPTNFKEIALQTNEGREIAQTAILEFTRMLHNFLASSSMLIDVTRRWVGQQFANTEFLNTYNNEIKKRFSNNVQAQFLKDLRNFTMHRTLPLLVPSMRLQQIDEHHLKSSLGIVLLKNYLLEWDNWSELGRMQIQMADNDEVDILSIIDQHFDNETKFMQWLFWRIREIYSKEIDYINSMLNSFNKHPSVDSHE